MSENKKLWLIVGLMFMCAIVMATVVVGGELLISSFYTKGIVIGSVMFILGWGCNDTVAVIKRHPGDLALARADERV